jgi:hypothetical protein
MSESHLVHDQWIKPDVRQVVATLEGSGAPYWVCAGLGLDLFVGREMRAHHDADVAVLRRDQLAFRDHLRDWDLQIAIGWQEDLRVVTEWRHGESVPDSEGAVWCRPSRSKPWMFELLLNENEEDWWCLKRNRSIRLPLDSIGGKRDGLPFLNPEIILLHKATSARYDAGDDRDFENTLPLLNETQRRWLARSIAVSHGQHPWLELLHDDKRFN